MVKQPRLKQFYKQEVLPKLKKELNISNDMAVPKIVKVVVSMGITQPQDSRQRRQVMGQFVEQLSLITGQKPIITKARKSISGFKLRQGDPVGVSVTLRGIYMWEFLDKLISIVLPQVKDFRGISKKAFDGHGNYSLGLKEQIIFPEIDYDKISVVKGMQINIVTDTDDNEKAFKLLESLGFPFEKKESNKNKRSK